MSVQSEWSRRIVTQVEDWLEAWEREDLHPTFTSGQEYLVPAMAESHFVGLYRLLV